MPNPFVHVELNTSDLGAAKKFYRKLFDWSLGDMPMGPGMTYTTIGVGPDSGGVGGGMQKSPASEMPSQWLSYVLVADVKKSIKKAEKLGAKILEAYLPVPGMGALGIFQDPTGAVLGLWQPEMKAPPAKGAPAKKKAPAKKAPAKKAPAKKAASRK